MKANKTKNKQKQKKTKQSKISNREELCQVGNQSF
jgi:hypothetical protein